MILLYKNKCGVAELYAVLQCLIMKQFSFNNFIDYKNTFSIAIIKYLVVGSSSSVRNTIIIDPDDAEGDEVEEISNL